MKALKKLMSKIVTDYLIRPSSEIEKTPQLESIESGGKSIWHKVLLGCDAVTLKNNATDWQKPMSRQEQYQIQGMSIPLFPISQQEPIESTVNMIVLFISGSNSHLFSCRQRAIECAYATKTAIQNRSKSARVLLSRFNPFGVINQVKNNNQALPYTAQALSQEDIASDYYQCAKLLLKTYENAQMVIMGHSLGGVFSKKVFKKLKDNPFLSNRVELVYSAMSLHGISDAFMYYRPSRMLKNIIPSSNRETISWIINAVNDYGFKCVQRVLKMAVDISGWKTESVECKEGDILQSNLVKDNRDDYIPDEVASVQNETVWDWLFITEKKHNAHNLPPSQMFQLLQNKKVSELEKITKFLEKLLGQKEKMTVLE